MPRSNFFLTNLRVENPSLGLKTGRLMPVLKPIYCIMGSLWKPINQTNTRKWSDAAGTLVGSSAMKGRAVGIMNSKLERLRWWQESRALLLTYTTALLLYNDSFESFSHKKKIINKKTNYFCFCFYFFNSRKQIKLPPTTN